MPAASPRLAIVVSHPIQYYSPWFRWMASNTALQLRVFYLWDAGVKPALDAQFGRTFAWDVDLLTGYEHEFVPNTSAHPGSDHFSGLKNPALNTRLKAWSPDFILLFGYNYATHLRLILWARLRGIPVIFRGDSHLLGRHAPSFLKRFPLALLYRQFAAFATVGLANQDYFRAFGVPEKELFFVPHCVDSSRFTVTAELLITAAKLRESIGLAGRRVVLFAGKLVPAKQPLALLTSFIELAPANTALVFVGDGEERSTLEALAATRPDLAIHFLPFANQSEMPSRYLLADLFVLPSKGLYETWGLAVNEAMHLGVPCLVSDRVGCQRNLVTDGETGWVFPAEQSGALTTALQRALDGLSSNAVSGLRTRIAERISGYTYETATAGLLKAVNFVLPRTSTKP